MDKNDLKTNKTIKIQFLTNKLGQYFKKKKTFIV